MCRPAPGPAPAAPAGPGPASEWLPSESPNAQEWAPIKGPSGSTPGWLQMSHYPHPPTNPSAVRELGSTVTSSPRKEPAWPLRPGPLVPSGTLLAPMTSADPSAHRSGPARLHSPPQLPGLLPAGSPRLGYGPSQAPFTLILPTGPSASRGLGRPSASFPAEGLLNRKV